MIPAPRNGKLELCVLIFVAAFALSQEELLERKPELAQYQDAWKVLKVPGRYYLFMRSYEKEPFYKHKKCVFNELVSVNEEEQYTVNLIGATDPNDGSQSNQTAYAWVRASEGYPLPNVIQSSLTLDRKRIVEFPVAFTEYNNCEILRVPHRKNGCELWVKAGEENKIESLCFFVFHLLCGPSRYAVYDPYLCNGK
ncbi:male-specific histamine-binding salivary protein-like [Dermacentor albipictus]|uniref:male-specific histamine-binding salivary protein-like n=1 Tax=Dermacentor albipictus TaxID=60249 RepID=UPI0038FD3BE8